MQDSPSFIDACNKIYSVKPVYSKSHCDDDTKRELKLYTKKIFGCRIIFPSIVVSGTKGKGSVSTVCESVLRSCGLTTLLFTSPHLISPTERIKINGENISENEFVSLYQEVINELKEKELPIPFFPNFFTLMFAFLVLRYQRQNSKNVVAIIEVGLGGKLDWTKYFKPLVCIISRLDFDHTEILGESPYSIAWNKFGIITKSSINFTIPQSPHFNESLIKLEQESGRKLYFVKPNWKKEMGLSGPTAEINTSASVIASLELMLKINFINSGQVQLNLLNNIHDNKECDDISFIDEALRNKVEEGVKNAHIDGRYQVLIYQGIKWCIDGAHTCESIAICNNWFDYECKKDNFSDRKDLLLLCATSKNRDPNKTLETLLNEDWGNIFYITSFGKIELQCKNATLFENTEKAIQKVIEIHPKTVLATGSLYLVGEVLKQLK